MIDRVLTRATLIPGFRTLWHRFPLGSLSTRVRYGVFSRPNYAYGVYYAADLAKNLGLPGISVVELGVAGGRGLVALEEVSQLVSKDMDLPIHVVGFDTGTGMPPPVDYRDLPHVWGPGDYRMDESKLRAKLSPSTELVLGPIEETMVRWSPKLPLGFIAFDLDYYSSTRTAFQLFERAPDCYLPRVYCYFDDLIWPEYAGHNEFTGELCAINDFNREHSHKKLCPINMLRHTRVHEEAWNEMMYMLHDFNHPLYCKNITHTDRMLPL